MRKIIGGVVVSIAPPCWESPSVEPQSDNYSELSEAAGSLYEHMILQARRASARASEWTACLLDRWAASAHSAATRLSH